MAKSIKLEPKIILNSNQLKLTIHRLAYQLIENHNDFSNSIIVGLQPRGILLAKMLHRIISQKLQKEIDFGILDHSLYRDDLHLKNSIQTLSENKMPHNIENKNIILIDDVLFTGRSIRSALDALVDYGRPRDIELLVLIDRKLHRHMPIQAKYVGKTIDSIDSEKVNVSLQNPIEESIVYLTQTNHPSQEP
jgi:pyrimidine operon attenuation protein/uracil phosphoribosyltransferase